MTPPIPSPQGSLEELFRHHLLESEAAAVPPLPHVWEQLDNSLLLAQNKRYRRRLVAYHWAMAASLLLTVLAGGGWWRSQYRAQPGADLASAGSTAGDPAAMAPRLGAATAGLSGSAAIVSSSTLATYPIEQTLTLATSSYIVGGRHAFGSDAATELDNVLYQSGRQTRLAGRIRAASALPAGMGMRAGLPTADAAATSATTALPAAELAADGADLAATGGEPLGAEQLRMRLAALQLPPRAGLPTSLQTADILPPAARKSIRPWQLQVAYAGGLFDPNIDFTKLPNEYNGNLGPGTVSTTREAAAEYRHNLRPGVGQRLSVWATRRLGIGRWSLRTGLEMAQNMASSASSVGFVGEQVATLNPDVQVLSNRLQGTTYRYRSVSVPVEAIYTNPVRPGFSLYGRVGALVTSMLQVHSEVDGNDEATRTYGLRSVGSPYRHVGASVRGGVGMRYEPASRQWALNLGPVAEAGVLSLNIDPTQTFWNQHRPYSFGLEAGVEFNSLLRPASAPQP